MEHHSHFDLNFEYPDGAALAQRSPYMFNKPHLGFDFYRGWQPILSVVCVALDDMFKAELGDNYEGFAWRQIKETFGTARFYYQLVKPEQQPSRIILLDGTQRARRSPADWDLMSNTVDKLVSAGQTSTQMTCMACGAKAEQSSGPGCITTLCDKHRLYVSDGIDVERRHSFWNWMHLPGVVRLPGKTQ